MMESVIGAFVYLLYLFGSLAIQFYIVAGIVLLIVFIYRTKNKQKN